MIAPGRSIADRPPLRLVVRNDAQPAWVPARAPDRLTGLPLALAWAGMVAGGWCFVAGLAWTAYAVCRVTGVVR